MSTASPLANLHRWYDLCARFSFAWDDYADSQVLGSILREQADWIAANVAQPVKQHTCGDWRERLACPTYVAMRREENEAMAVLADALGWQEDPEYGYPFGDHTLPTLAEEVRQALLHYRFPGDGRGYQARHRGYDPTATPGEAWYGVKP